MINATKATLERLRALNAGDVAKAWTTATGLVNFDLEAGAKKLYPVLTPLRNEIPRVKSMNGDVATHWKAITAVNTTNLRAGVGNGNRGGIITSTVTSYLATYKGLGLEDTVDYEAQYASESFDDARARAVEGLLASLMIMEEKVILGGNTSFALGTPAAPVAAVAAGGAITQPQTLFLYVVALTAAGLEATTIAGGCPGLVSRTNADTTVDTYGGGNSAVSAASNSQATSSGNQTINGTVTVVKGAAGYAWYLGTSAATAALAAITTINSVSIAANPAGTQFANDAKIASDRSTNALEFDGLLTLSNAGSTGYFAAQATGVAGTGTGLTPDGVGGIKEFEVANKYFWDNFRSSPDEYWLSAQEVKNLPGKVLVNGATPIVRFNLDAKNLTNDGAIIGAGIRVGTYLNKYGMAASGKNISLRLHPNLPAGTILIVTRQVPYSLSGVQNLIQIKARQEYYAIEWAKRTRKYEFGDYVDEVLQHYFPSTLGVIQNIGDN
jgi:hypothetical protein